MDSLLDKGLSKAIIQLTSQNMYHPPFVLSIRKGVKGRPDNRLGIARASPKKGRRGKQGPRKTSF
jgi:hypothetical protein